MPAWGNHITDKENGIDVPALTIEQICDLYELPVIDLLKIDIEGAECDVFRHGTFLNRVEFIITELHGNYDVTNFEADVAPHGLVAIGGGNLPGVSLTIGRR
jgi:hypothetical protein